MSLETEIDNILEKARTGMNVSQLTRMVKCTSHEGRVRRCADDMADRGKIHRSDNSKGFIYSKPKFYVKKPEAPIVIKPRERKEKIPEQDHIGARIKRLRLKKDIGRADFGKKIGKAPNTVSDYETCRYPMSEETIKKICQILEVSPNELFDYEAWK